MTAQSHRLRDRLDIGGLALGMGLRQFQTSDMGRMLSVCGYDWALIDLEHSSMSVETAARLAVACEDAGVTPLVRVPSDDHRLATRLLDGGAMGVDFPHIETSDQAARLVETCMYPPFGHRSMGGSRLTQLGFRAYDRGEAAALGNEATFMVMMIETPVGLTNAEAIASVPGVDVLLVGSNDLTLEMGIPGELGHDRLSAAFEAVVAACSGHGKHAGMAGVYDLTLIERYVKLGTRFVLGAGDSGIFMSGARSTAEELRRFE